MKDKITTIRMKNIDYLELKKASHRDERTISEFVTKAVKDKIYELKRKGEI